MPLQPLRGALSQLKSHILPRNTLTHSHAVDTISLGAARGDCLFAQGYLNGLTWGSNPWGLPYRRRPTPGREEEISRKPHQTPRKSKKNMMMIRILIRAKLGLIGHFLTTRSDGALDYCNRLTRPHKS